MNIRLKSDSKQIRLTSREYAIKFEQVGKRGLTGERGEKGDKGDKGDPATNLVQSVNAKQGVVILTASDVGADSAGSADDALVKANSYTDTAVAPKADKAYVDTQLNSKQPTGDYATNTALTSGLATKADTSSLAPVATSGDYTDLTNKPAPLDISGKADITYVDTQDASVASTAQSNLTAHTSNVSNPHSVTKAQVGLGNVDNTSDVNKPVSTAQATAINAKVTGVGRVYIQLAAPSSPLEGDLWVDLS